MRLAARCNEKDFELEIKSRDNRILEEQLKNKVAVHHLQDSHPPRASPFHVPRPQKVSKRRASNNLWWKAQDVERT
ncbi:hypothetical protein Scep_004256 [Stephania cephalantha]|uniref:Uncharacterized protein n=1 Tax=Stephania cephalantha TaxID=152367 RepID=A0AAP0KTW6_9MAGN